MNRDQLPIPEPCSASWDAMTGGASSRFCDHCSKHVHDLSAMTEGEAVRLLAGPGSLCVRYTADADGRVLHRRSGAGSRLLAAAAALLSASPALAAPAPAEETPSLIEWARTKITEALGSERVVTQGEVEVVMGDVAVVEPPPPPPPPRHPAVMGRIARPHVVPDPIPEPPVEVRLPQPADGQTVIPEVQAALDQQR